MDKIAVLIPAYNEGITIAKVVTDAKTYLPEATVYVYDNNSTDNTAEGNGSGFIRQDGVRCGRKHQLQKCSFAWL